MTAARTGERNGARNGARHRSAPAAPARATRSRPAVRSLPQEVTGPRPRLSALPRRRTSARTVLVMGAALFFVLLAGSVTIQAQRIEAQHRIDQLDVDLVEAREQQRKLRAEVAVAESPERVMAAADGLGMVQPASVLPLLPVQPAPRLDAVDPADPADPDEASIPVGPSARIDEQAALAGG